MIEGSQVCELIWPGKAEAMALADTAPGTRLRSWPELGHHSATTKNQILEGDNLEALKLLRPAYEGRIQVIYIDPPYNLGHSKLYRDDFSAPGIDRHSGYLSFMAPRLRLAKSLLRPDGVMFISIDDGEDDRLKLLCKEIFGEQNVETMVWQKVGEGDAGAGRMKITRRFRREHEYVLACYGDVERVRFAKYSALPHYMHKYGNPDNDPRGAYKGGNISRTEALSHPGGKNYYTVTSPDGKRSYSRQFHFDQETFASLERDGRIYWGRSGHGVPQLKIFLGEKQMMTPVSVICHRGSATSANKEMRRLFGAVIFPHSKPLELLEYLLALVPADEDTVILDFFAGSCVTASAVWKLNQRDQGCRRFIMVQSAEPCAAHTEAAKWGFQTVAEIGRARLLYNATELENKLGVLSAGFDSGFEYYRLEKLENIDESK